MTIEQDKVLPWLKWFTKDVKNYREVFSNEQMGELFFAAMKKVENNEAVAVSNEIKFAYLQLCTAIDEARAAYFEKCETNAKNGAKGGKAKAAKAKAKKDEFKPPSKTDFRNMAKHICREYDIENCDQYTIDNIFDEFSDKNWKFYNASLKSKSLLECATFFELTKDILSFRILLKAIKENYDINLNTLVECSLGYNEDLNEYYIDGKSFKNEDDLLMYFYGDEEE